MTQGSAIPALSGTVTGFVNGDTLGSATTGTLGFTTAANTSSPAGSYAISGSGLVANYGDYLFVQAAGNATALTIEATTATPQTQAPAPTPTPTPTPSPAPTPTPASVASAVTQAISSIVQNTAATTAVTTPQVASATPAATALPAETTPASGGAPSDTPAGGGTQTTTSTLSATSPTPDAGTTPATADVTGAGGTTTTLPGPTPSAAGEAASPPGSTVQTASAPAPATDVASASAPTTTLLGPAPDAAAATPVSSAGTSQTASAPAGNDTGGLSGSATLSTSGGGSLLLGSSTQGSSTPGTTSTAAGQPSGGTAQATNAASTGASVSTPTTAGGVTAPVAAPVVMVASVPVMTTPAAPTLGQIAQTPRVQQSVQTVNTALTTVATGGGSVRDIVAAMNTGTTKLTMQEQKAVFASVPAPKLVSGLLGSSNPVDNAVGGQLKQVASGNVSLSYADVKAVLMKGGVNGTTALSYLAMYQVVHKEAMTTLFSGALKELAANPNAADIQTGALSAPARGTRSVGGITATDTGGAVKAAVPIEAFHRVVLPKASAEQDSSGRTIIRGRIENWQPGMDLSSLLGSHALQFASLDGGSLEDYLGPSFREQVAETPPTKIEGWTGGRQVRINGRWIFVHDDGSFDLPLPAGTPTDSIKLTIVDEHGEVHEQTVAVQAGGGGTNHPPRPRKIAVLFANSAYGQNGIPDLHTPPNDAARVSEVLHNRLGYVTQVISNPTKADMVAAIEALHSEATEADQVFIYYAGHGYENERTGVGYWLPSDATTTSARNWMSTKDLARLLRRVPAKNIMLVADSCYSGSFTKEQNFQGGGRSASLEELGSLRGVMAMSSGGDEPVMDGEVNSPFARALVDRMKEIAAATVGDELYSKVRADVTANTPQTPQYGVISSAGYDPGADYLIRNTRAQIGAR